MSAPTGGLAEAARRGEREAVERIAGGPLELRPDNLVERPWGGRRILAYKGLEPVSGELPERRIGEIFEVSAFPADPEAAAHPSIVSLADGSEIELPELLTAAGSELLGEPFLRSHGACVPLLPKTLDVAELLSIQTHPPGNPEVYVVIEAEEGATLRLGLRREVDRRALRRELEEGLELQRELEAAARPGVEPRELQRALSPCLGHPGTAPPEALDRLAGLLRPESAEAALRRPLARLRAIYWRALDLLHPIPLTPGQVIYNARPAPPGEGPPSSDLHALGNPEGREALLLEVRRPGPTLRAWDHARFPRRRIDLDEALATLPEVASPADRFVVEPRPLADRPGVERSVANELFVVDHLRPRPGRPVALEPEGLVRTLHQLRGRAVLRRADGALLAALRPGRSLLLPVSLPPCRLETEDPATAAVLVSLPLPAG